MRTQVLLLGILALAAIILTGCGKNASESKPMGEVMAEAEKMSVSEIRSMALAYKDAIMAKEKDLASIAARLREIPVTQVLGEQAKELRVELDKLQDSMKNHTARFEVYVGQLKKQEGDLSGLTL